MCSWVWLPAVLSFRQGQPWCTSHFHLLGYPIFFKRCCWLQGEIRAQHSQCCVAWLNSIEAMGSSTSKLNVLPLERVTIPVTSGLLCPAASASQQNNCFYNNCSSTADFRKDLKGGATQPVTQRDITISRGQVLLVVTALLPTDHEGRAVEAQPQLDVFSCYN